MAGSEISTSDPGGGGGGPPSAGYSSVLRADPGDGPAAPEQEYRGVPPSEEEPPAPAAAGADPDDLDNYVADPKSRAFWVQMVESSNGMFKSIAAARDAVDNFGWRDREAAVRLAKQARETAARSVPKRHGKVANRSYRQVNVKLGEPDYEALKALAITRDLPPSTMARILVRNALREAAGL